MVLKEIAMSVATYEAVVENGQVKLPAGLVLPESQTVYIIVPETGGPRVAKMPGFRLSNPEHAKMFELQVTWEDRA
jgi:hypothetical protein